MAMRLCEALQVYHQGGNVDIVEMLGRILDVSWDDVDGDKSVLDPKYIAPTLNSLRDFLSLMNSFKFQTIDLQLIRAIFIGLGKEKYGSNFAEPLRRDLVEILLFFILRGTNIAGAFARENGTSDALKTKLKAWSETYKLVSPKQKSGASPAGFLIGKAGPETLTVGRIAAAFPVWTAATRANMAKVTHREVNDAKKDFVMSEHSLIITLPDMDLLPYSVKARFDRSRQISEKTTIDNIIQFSSLTEPATLEELKDFYKAVSWSVLRKEDLELPLIDLMFYQAALKIRENILINWEIPEMDVPEKSEPEASTSHDSRYQGEQKTRLQFDSSESKSEELKKDTKKPKK